MRFRTTHFLFSALALLSSCSAPARDNHEDGGDGGSGGSAPVGRCEALRRCCESDSFPASGRDACLVVADEGSDEVCGPLVTTYGSNGFCDDGGAGSSGGGTGGGQGGDGGAGGVTTGGSSAQGGGAGSSTGGASAGTGGGQSGAPPTGGVGGAAGTGAGTGGSGGELPAACTGKVGSLSTPRVYSGAPVEGACSGATDPPYLGFWYSFNDGTSVQTPDPALPLLGELGGHAGAADCAIRTQGVNFTDWGAGIGFDLDVAETGRCAFNAGVFRGIRMVLKGSTVGSVGDNLVRVKLPTVRTTDQAGGTCLPTATLGCSDDYGLFCTVSPTSWTLCDVSFSLIAQEGWGVPAAFVPQELLGIQLLATRWLTSISFDVSVDDIQFY